MRICMYCNGMGCHRCDGRGFVTDWSFEALKADALSAYPRLQIPTVQGTSAAICAERDFALNDFALKPLRFKPDAESSILSPRPWYSIPKAETFLDDDGRLVTRFVTEDQLLLQPDVHLEEVAVWPAEKEIHINVKKRTTLLFNFNN